MFVDIKNRAFQLGFFNFLSYCLQSNKQIYLIRMIVFTLFINQDKINYIKRA